jgi:putative membrane protein
MQRWSLGLIGTLCATAAFASVDGGDPKPLVPGASALAPVARPSMFAAASAPFARRFTPEQREEARFLKDAAAAARFEHDASKLALAKSGDANVRTLAAALVNHQSASLPALQRMLHARNMAPPMLANDQRKALNRLGKLQGAKFDREWMEFVALRSQQESLQSFEKVAATAHDPQLRAWVDRALPTMRYQLAGAERIVSGGTKFAKLSPMLPPGAIKGPAANVATRAMGAPPPAMMTTGDLGEGNMVLGPPRNVAVKLTEPSIR